MVYKAEVTSSYLSGTSVNSGINRSYRSGNKSDISLVSNKKRFLNVLDSSITIDKLLAVIKSLISSPLSSVIPIVKVYRLVLNLFLSLT